MEPVPVSEPTHPGSLKSELQDALLKDSAQDQQLYVAILVHMCVVYLLQLLFS